MVSSASLLILLLLCVADISTNVVRRPDMQTTDMGQRGSRNKRCWYGGCGIGVGIGWGVNIGIGGVPWGGYGLGYPSYGGYGYPAYSSFPAYSSYSGWPGSYGYGYPVWG